MVWFVGWVAIGVLGIAACSDDPTANIGSGGSTDMSGALAGSGGDLARGGAGNASGTGAESDCGACQGGASELAGASGDDPASCSPSSPVQAIGVGVGYACALLETGGVRCWGSPGPALGDPAIRTFEWKFPKHDVLSDVQAIAVGQAHVCALTKSGGVRCWGDNTGGQLGDGTTEARDTPPTSDVLGPK